MGFRILDIEADSLQPTEIWCVCEIDVDSGEEFVWRYDEGGPNNEWHSSPNTTYIGHNIISYDLPSINKLTSNSLDYTNSIDTLVCSRLFNQQIQGHSLGDWGSRLGETKGIFTEWARYEDYSAERDRMDRCVRYCLQDCRANLKLFNFLRPHIFNPKWKESLRLEHDTAQFCQELSENGFAFDIEKAEGIYRDLQGVVAGLGTQLQEAFPPRSYEVRSVIPKLTKHGTINRTDFRWTTDQDLTAYTAGHPFSVIGWEEFSPSSPKQVVTRLNEAGWEPYEKTKGYKAVEKELQDIRRRNGARAISRSTVLQERVSSLEAKSKYYETYGWTISEENLETLPEDANEGTKLLVKHRMLNKRLQTFEEWFGAYRPSTGRIHGNFTHIGTWTHRKSHSGPNMGNTPSVDSKYHAKELKDLAYYYGKEMRSCWIVPEGKVLIGTDADGIQLRILAHYMNDLEFTTALVSGVKNDDNPERSTDVHTLNAVKLGLGYKYRPRAKTFSTIDVSKQIELRENLEQVILSQAYHSLV